MKIYLIIALVMANISISLAQNTKPVQTTKPATAKSDTIVKYTCSMHPEISLDKPGKCPKCGMALIKKAVKQEVKTTSYQCPMKCEGEKVYTKAGSCPKCGMDLEELKGSHDKIHDHKSK